LGRLSASSFECIFSMGTGCVTALGIQVAGKYRLSASQTDLDRTWGCIHFLRNSVCQCHNQKGAPVHKRIASELV
jgi:hypothetical protein